MQTLLANSDEPSATSRERMALAYIACSGQSSPECTALLDGSAEKQGIMSQIFALHLMNNGVTSAQYTQAQLLRMLCDRQAPDGGWSLAGDFGDPDVTAMTLQALAPYRDAPEAADAVARGVDYLAAAQLESGAYRSFGTENPESAAQVWIALCALGSDPLTDARFIKNGKTLFDAFMQFSLGGGRYAHSPGGAESASAAMQICLALTAQCCLHENRSLYLFCGDAPAWAGVQTTAPQTTAAQTTPKTAESKTSATASQQTSTASVQRDTETGTDTNTAAPHTAETTETTAAQTTAASSTAAPQTSSSATASSAESVSARTTAQTAPDIPRESRYPYRIPLTCVIWAGGGIAAVICILRKKRGPKSYLTAAGICAALTAAVWLIRVELPDDYYTPQSRAGGGCVTMEIRCDVILGMPGSERFPADGVILPLTEFAIEPEENALTLLYDAVRAYGLQIEVDGVSGDLVETAYVRGIASLYEFDFGDLSGWTYTVNGERPPVGCGAYTLHDGDCVVWAYTVSL